MGSPKLSRIGELTPCACLEAGIIDADQARQAVELADDRNLTVHTYNEALARPLTERLPRHALLLRKWLDRLKS